jgi:PAP2 superfamily
MSSIVVSKPRPGGSLPTNGRKCGPTRSDVDANAVDDSQDLRAARRGHEYGAGAKVDNHVNSLNLLIAGLVALTLVVTAYGMYATNIALRSNAALYQSAVLVVLLFLLGRWVARRGMRRPSDVATILLWLSLCHILHVLPMYVAGRMHVAFSDPVVAGWDRALGVETRDVVAFMRRHPMADGFLGYVYLSLEVMITGTLILASMTGRIAVALENIVASVISVLISFPIFAVFQLWGPWRYYGYSPLIDQRGYEAEFAALKQLDFFYLDFACRKGIISFPSFHTILAVLAGVTLSRLPYAWPLGAPWAILIVLSTVTTGTHYVADVLAGVAVAAVSMVAASCASGALARSGARSRS